MDIWAILEVLGILFGIGLGIIGAAPQIIDWSKAKPYLLLVYYNFERPITRDLKVEDYCLHLILNNDSLLWHRSHDATDVKVECHITDMNRDQCGDIQTFEISKCLPVGEGANKRFTIGTEECREELNPHTLVFKIVCKEGRMIERRAPFNYHSYGALGEN
jgi:hypothetical protein